MKYCFFAFLLMAASLLGQDQITIPHDQSMIPQGQTAIPQDPFSNTQTEAPIISHEKQFSNPGVIERHQEKWVGSDYLGHLSNQIDVRVEILQSQSQGQPMMFDEGSLERLVKDIFRKEGITPATRFSSTKPPLPFLHILIMVYAIPRNAYLIFCSARLFEEVNVVREKFIPRGNWQAITWETQELIIAQKDKVVSQVEDLVEDVSNLFVKRYRAYNPISPDASPFRQSMPRIRSTRPPSSSEKPREMR